MNLRLAVTTLAAIALAGCNLSKQGAPGLSGPSTLGRSVTLAAAPDRLLYDGLSQTVITATVRDAAGKGEANVPLRWAAEVVTINGGVTTATGIPVEPSPQVTNTGSSGQTSTVVRAPLAPDVMPDGQVMMRVTATTLGDDASQLAPGLDAKERTIVVELVPLTGSSAPNRLPVPDFTVSPAIANINQTVTFDASLTKDEGVVCGDRCTYVWDLGSEFATKSGRVATSAFTKPGDYTIRLFVTDDRGATAPPKALSLRVNGPSAPIASFTVLPAGPKNGVAATLDGSGSKVGEGATIAQYAWNFGDGAAPQTTTVPAVTHTWVTGTYVATLTVTDSLGRTATTTATVTVTP